MRLNITRIRPDDFGEYQCVSKNEINTTTKMFYVYGKWFVDAAEINSISFRRKKKKKQLILPNRNRPDKTRNPGRIYEGPSETGTLPPKLISYKDLCPPPNCPASNCSEAKCKETLVNLYDLVKHFEMKPFVGTHYMGLQNRTLGMCLTACRKIYFTLFQLLFSVHPFSFMNIARNFATTIREQKKK